VAKKALRDGHVNPAAPRPALAALVAAMGSCRATANRGSSTAAARPKREAARIRRLTRAVTAEVRQLLAAREGDELSDQVRRLERAAARKKKARPIPRPALMTFRMAELFDYFNSPYGCGGAPLPDDDAGRGRHQLMVQVLSTSHDAASRMWPSPAPGRPGCAG